MSKPSHIPVLVEEALKLLDPQPSDIIVDATVGLGGHTKLLAEKLGPTGRVIGIDQDEDALHIANDNLKVFGNRVVLVRGNFRHLSDLVESAGYQSVNGILFDLGFSSLQIETGERGFSFLHDAPLDMRMDATDGETTAGEIVNRASFNELVKIFQDYGEEPKAESIARKILEARQRGKITTTGQLVEIIGGSHQGRIHPATRVFQALRIAVNDELQALTEALPQAIDLLAPNGRIAVITFHSLEDRIVKNFFKAKATGGRIQLLAKKAIAPSWQEQKRNPRARSAKIRGAIKIE